MPRVQRPSPFIAECLRAIPLDAHVTALDAPCGSGRHAVELCRLGCEVTALDINRKRVEATARKLSARRPAGRWKAQVADLEQAAPGGPYDLALIVDYAAEAGILNVAETVRQGGVLILETFRANGSNWTELPPHGRLRDLLEPTFELLLYEERSAGPEGADAASVRCVAKRR